MTITTIITNINSLLYLSKNDYCHMVFWGWFSPAHENRLCICWYFHNWAFSNVQSVSSVQSFSRVRLFATPWITAHQATLSITNSQSSLRLTSIEWVMLSSHLIFCHPFLLLPSIFPRIRVLSKESVLPIRCQSIGASASASILPINIQDWFRLGLRSNQSILRTSVLNIHWKDWCWSWSSQYWKPSFVTLLT